MVQATPRDYWISPTALTFTFNALNLPDYVQVSCVSGAQILVYVKGIIPYDEGHNYRRWTLQAAPTVFNTHTAKYVYVALPRDMQSTQSALIVFPSEEIDIYGQNAAGEQIGSDDRFYIFLQGIISSSGDNGTVDRRWLQAASMGYLSSDEALDAGPTDTEWYEYAAGVLTFLKDLTMKAGTAFIQLMARSLTILSGGSIQFEGQDGQLTGVASTDTPLTAPDKAVTPVYMDTNALSKAHSDSTPYDLAMRDLAVHGDADIFGNTVIEGNLQVGAYAKGLMGAQVDFYGNAEFESIVARSFLEVPELRYNRTTITVGNRWQTVGAGIIGRVWLGKDVGMDSLEGVARLKLEPGEIGAIAVDDKCQGVFHFDGGTNDPSTTDSRDGNFHFAGFTTIYFLIKEIYTDHTLPAAVMRDILDEGEQVGDHQYFRYELRAKSCAALPAEDRNRWTDTSHPQPALHFAAYANATDSSRQASRLTTTTYQLHLAGMTGWTYTQDNMRLIIGWLSGFSVLQQVWDEEQKKFVTVNKELTGEGIATGNIYMWGTIDQFARVPSLVSQQLYFRTTASASERPQGIQLAPDRLSVILGEWQKEAPLPTAQERAVWQQWVFTYSDGTMAVGEVAFQSADPTALTAQLNRTVVSLAVGDWYDASAPDEITFDLTARLLSGTTAQPLTSATAVWGDGTGSATEGGVTLTFTTDLSTDLTQATLHITLHGYVGVMVNGTVPEDTFITVTLQSESGTAAAVATLAQNRRGEDGAPGATGDRGYTGLSVRRGEWEAGVMYRNDSADGSLAPDGHRYLDEVSVTDIATGQATWYLALPAHNGIASSADNAPTVAGGTLWQKINDMRPLRTSYADIYTAFIEFLRVRQIEVTDDDGQPYGAFGGGTGQQYPLWFGGTTPQDARTKFNRQGDFWSGPNFSVVDGQIKASGGTFSGITAVNGTFSGQITASMLKLDMATNKSDETINGTVFKYEGGILPSLFDFTGVLQLICFVPQLTREAVEVPVSCGRTAGIYDSSDGVTSDGTRSVTLGAGIYIFYGFRHATYSNKDYWFYKKLL